MVNQECYRLPNTETRPFSSSVKFKDIVFASGTSGTVDDSGKPIEGIQDQTRQCLKNLEKELKLAGASLSDVLKIQVFLARAEDWSSMNDAYKEFFPKQQPARTAIVVGLIRPDMLVEMECIAHK